LVYNESAKQLILRLKHGDAVDLCVLFAKWLNLAEMFMVDGIDYVVPVPLHWSRLFNRLFNQSSMLILYWLKQSTFKAHYAPFLLRRSKRTQSQGVKTNQERFQNVSKAFSVPLKYKSLLKGKSVLLIDDVMTTGATLNACAKSLKDEGAKKVNVLTLAKRVLSKA